MFVVRQQQLFVPDCKRRRWIHRITPVMSNQITVFSSQSVWATSWDVMSLPALYEINPSISERNRLVNMWETLHYMFHNIIKFVLTQQLLKTPHLLMESGDVVLLVQWLEDVSWVAAPSACSAAPQPIRKQDNLLPWWWIINLILSF